MKIKCKFLTQTQLGSLFGATSHEVGKWLVNVGLRDGKTKKPTDAAHRGGFCETAPSGQSGYHWVWSAEKTIEAIHNAGYSLLTELPEELVDPSPLSGPFRLSESCLKEILNADGSLALRASCQRNAEVVMKLLTIAYQRGVISRFYDKVNVPTEG